MRTIDRTILREHITKLTGINVRLIRALGRENAIDAEIEYLFDELRTRVNAMLYEYNHIVQKDRYREVNRLRKRLRDV